VISKQDIQNLAELARLEVHDAEVEALQKDMAGILAYVEAVSAAEIPSGLTGRDMGSVPQRDCEGSSEKEKQQAPRALHNVMRDDTPRTQDDPLWAKEEALRQAFPTSESDYNVVRKIIQKDE